MRNRLDELFKNKLSDHSLAPSVNAWDRVKDRLAKKNNKPLVLRIAAAALLVGALTTTLLRLSSNDPASNSPPSVSLGKNAESKISTERPANPSPRSIAVEKKKRAQQTVVKKKRERADENDRRAVIEDQNNVTLSIMGAEEPNQPNDSSGTVSTTNSQPIDEKPIVLVYRLESIGPNPVVDSASAPGPREMSGLLKAINFARDAKNGDVGLGNLRQAKDELFVFNFKKDKQNNHK